MFLGILCARKINPRHCRPEMHSHPQTARLVPEVLVVRFVQDVPATYAGFSPIGMCTFYGRNPQS